MQKTLQLPFDSFRTAFTMKIEDDYSCNYKFPQELLARRYFHARGIDISINSPSNLVSLIIDWLENPKKYCLIQQAYRHKPLIGDRDGIRQLI